MNSAHTIEQPQPFSRNWGLLTRSEMGKLSRSCVAIPGLGGVGGAHIEVLARHGIGRFKIADFDTFELPNFNRQFGATTRTVGKPKADVLRQHIKEINPRAKVDAFPDGIHPRNIDAFLEGVDVVVDSLDAFAIDARRLLYKVAHEKRIPVVSAGPLGFGATLLVALPGGMTFDEYCDITDELSEAEKFLRFILGTSPKGLHRPYMDMAAFDWHEKRGPSSCIGVTMCAAVAGTAVLRLLLDWGGVKALPHFAQYDVRRGIWAEGFIPWGNRNPLQKIKLALARRLFKQLLKVGSLAEMDERVPESPELYDDPHSSQAYIQASQKGVVALTERLFVREILKEFGHLPNLRVLDVGTGPGWIPTLLAKARPEWKITALDASPSMLAFAKRNAESQGAKIKWVKSDAAETGLQAHQFDLVVSHYAFHEFSDPLAVLTEMMRLTRHRGTIKIQDLKRPPRLLFPLVLMWGFLYSPEMRRQYWESLRAAYTISEMSEIFKSCGVVAQISARFGTHVRIQGTVSKATDTSRNSHPKQEVSHT
jgi:molybdopterin/thiamine biosynthesis adenylyltransferase/ubiquinone/menaquinone biosynthesis C-methylase UbiE